MCCWEKLLTRGDMMDDPKTKIEPLTPEQAAWYAEQEAKWRKEKKQAGIFMIVCPIFCVGIYYCIIFWGKFHVLRDPQIDTIELMSKVPDPVKFFFGGLAIISIILCGLVVFAAEKKLEKLQRERLFREK